MKDEQTKKEIRIAAEENALKEGILNSGELTPYSCSECHGVLSRLHNDNIIRYRCHTGHAYSADTLIAAITEKIEESLYSAVRNMKESVILLNHLGDYCAEANRPRPASLYFKNARGAGTPRWVCKAALMDEQLNKDSLRKEAEHENSPASELICP
ncbi:MAG: hypothetical protein ACTHMD_11000 [Flavisolibacter sp.]